MKCWGANYHGELGNGVSSAPSAPVDVQGLGAVTAIAVGGIDGSAFTYPNHACAISGGEVKCWGFGYHGQIANGTGTLADSRVPVNVWGASGATAISAGGYHTCALLSGGTVKCWGRGIEGQLGHGAFLSDSNPSSPPVSVQGLSGATALAAGLFHACAITSAGSVECWGSDSAGQLGDAVVGPPGSSTPKSAQGVGGATHLAAGNNHSCAVVSGGAVKCWGKNLRGQIGNGQTSVHQSTPVAVQGLTGATAVAAGDGHTCALVAGGAVKCWGDNAHGQLGQGPGAGAAPSALPLSVPGISGATTIAAAWNHTCAILTNGTVKCWGDNLLRQLGNGPSGKDAFAPTPIEVAGSP
jgi:alpha-tubulin suppressor-like RCC1 family protein